MSDIPCAYSVMPTHLKLTAKNNNHAYAEQMIRHGQCVINYKSVFFSVQTLTTFTCWCIQYDG